MKTPIMLNANLLLIRLLIMGAIPLQVGWASAQTFTTLHSFTNSVLDGDSPQAGLVLSSNTLYGTTYWGGYSGSGTVFAINTDGSGFNILYDFTAPASVYQTNSDGFSPNSPLVVSDNILYGTTIRGGYSGSGTVFAVNTDGSSFGDGSAIDVLYTFSPYDDISGTNSDGANPLCLTMAGNTLYGATEIGGIAGYGTIFAFDTDEYSFATLYTFTNGNYGEFPASLTLSGNLLYGETLGFEEYGTLFVINTNGSGIKTLLNVVASLPGGLVLSGGTLFGTTYNDNTSGNGTVFKVNTNGSGYQILHTFTGGGITVNGGLVLAAKTLYGTTMDGGRQGAGAIFAIQTDGTGFTNLYSFTGGADGENPNGSLVLSSNILYGTTQSGGNSDAGTIFSLALPMPPPDKNKPTLTITNPNKTGERWSNTVFTVAGTANDKIAVTNVLYSLNGGTWTNAVSTDNWTNWTASVTLIPGTNTIAAYAVNAGGNASPVADASVFFVVTNQLQIQASGLGTISPDYSNAWLNVGQNYSITSSPASGFMASSWVISTNWVGGVTTSGRVFHFTMASNLTLQVNFVDTNRPIVNITNIASGLTVNNSAFMVKGTASDNWEVASVWVELGSNGWVQANGTNHWDLQLTLAPGTNTVRAYAVDTSGNHSLTNSQEFFYSLSAPISLVVLGDGALIGANNGQLLQLGKSVTLTAKPGTGNVLTNWLVTVDGQTVLSTNKAVPFLMQSNLLLTATFVDVTKPIVNILSPTTPVLRATNRLVSIQVRATDNEGVDNLEFYLNGQEATAGLYLGSDLWSINLTLATGTNTINVTATDYSSNSTTKSIQVIYASNQMNTNSITFSERHSATEQLPSPPGFDFVTTQDAGLLNVALTVPALQFMPDDTWSNLFLSVSFGDFTFAESLSEAVVLSTSQATFYFGYSGDVSTAGQLTVARSGNTFVMTAQINNQPGQPGWDAYSFYTNYWYPDSALPPETSFQDQQPFNLSIQDGETSENYANVMRNIYIQGKMTASYNEQTGETYLTQVTGAADFTSPTNVITSPINGQHSSNAVFTVTGTAHDNIQVSNVWFQINGTSWEPATTENAWTNWTAIVTLTVGTNILSAYSVDASGNCSATNSVSLVSSNTFTLQLVFTSEMPLRTNGLVFNLQLSSGLNGHIQVSTNLTSWTTLTNFIGTNSTITFQDPEATNLSHRYYRAVIP